MKTAICKVNFTGYDWKNDMSVTSPTGKTIYFTTNGCWSTVSEELKAKFLEISDIWKFAKNGPGEYCGEFEFTYDEMRYMKSLADKVRR
jgi:hypothetical protein